MGSQLATLGFPRLDRSAISGNSEAHFDLCQAISRHILVCRGGNDPQFAGIAYRSRPSPEILNYAIFERSWAVILPRPSLAIAPDDPDLLKALRINRVGRYDPATDDPDT